MSKSPFKADTFRGMFAMIVNDPPPDRVMATGIVDIMRKYTTDESFTTDAGVWNACKHVVDEIVYVSGAASFYITALDVEWFYEAPVGAFCQSDGSIANAPWRKNRE